MKHFFKGAAALIIAILVSMIINVLCNIQGIDLDSTMTTVVSTICALTLYHTLIRNEQK